MSVALFNEIYLGSPIEHDSEREFLASIVASLQEQRLPFVVLANIQVDSHQIDFVVATEGGVSVVELKSSYLPVRGEINGGWARLDASGQWLPYPNAYAQALGAKNALRDSMRRKKQIGSFYPDGYVVFTTSCDRSGLTAGDFKVKVTSSDQFIPAGNASPWTLSNWCEFARELSLIRVSTEEALGSADTRQRVGLLRQYANDLSSEYEKDAVRWLPENPEQRSRLVEAATSSIGCYISGASGCGKTLMAKWLATHLSKNEGVAFFFAARDFTGSWSTLFRREIALVTDVRPETLRQVVARTDRPIFLILDGVNELAGQYKESALRGIRALARRFGARLIITAQERAPAEFSGLSAFAISRPSEDLKKRIALSRGIQETRAVLEVLKAVGTGLEADIVGQVGEEISSGATRLVLIDQLIRMRLRDNSRAALFGLRRLAVLLHEQIAFSIDEARFDNLMKRHDVSFNACDALFAAGLLLRRAGRVSFFHEMVQNVCAAVELVEAAIADPSAFGASLSTAILSPMAGDLISAIEDPAVCRAVLEQITSDVLLASVANDDFGAVAGGVARTLLGDCAISCIEELNSFRVALDGKEGLLNVSVVPDSQREWTAAEEARLRAIGIRAASGAGFDVVFKLCAAADERLEGEQLRLSGQAKVKGESLRSQCFALLYYGLGRAIGFTEVVRACQDFRATRKAVKPKLTVDEMTSGQLLMFLKNAHLFFDGEEQGDLAETLVQVLRGRFKSEPYHVQIEAMHACVWVRGAPEVAVGRLVGELNAIVANSTNIAVNSSIIEALKRFGALDEDAEAARDQIRTEVHSALGQDDDQDSCDRALSVCLRMFDHPYDSIYYEEIDALSEELRRELYRRALGSLEIKRSMSKDWLCGQVAAFGDPADVRLLREFAELPDPSATFPQDEWRAFAIATRFLGRHGADLPAVDEASLESRCLSEIRVLLHAVESKRALDVDAARRAWCNLELMPVQLVIGCLGEVQEALLNRHWAEAIDGYEPLSLSAIYRDECLKLARKFVDDGQIARYFQKFPHRDQGASFAFEAIGRLGDRSDLERVRRVSKGHPFSWHAIAALRSIDAVSS